MKFKFNSLEDFLISKPLNVDWEIDDGWGTLFPIKGREIEATILFSDISSFSKRTRDLNPIETLIFVNNFFSWITAEALQGKCGIVDKYIGDEIMIVFSKEFGSNDPFSEALQTARWMSENDCLGFAPHIGIASGRVVVGYVGTPMKYDCSVFGNPVALAARCTGIKSRRENNGGSIIFPAELWKERYSIDSIFPPQKNKSSNGEIITKPQSWELLPKRSEKIKNMPDTEVREIIKNSVWLPQSSPEKRAREAFKNLKEKGFYRS